MIFTTFQNCKNHGTIGFCCLIFMKSYDIFTKRRPEFIRVQCLLILLRWNFLVSAEKHGKPYINIDAFWSFWSPISNRRRVQNTKLNLRNIDGFGMRFSKENTSIRSLAFKQDSRFWSPRPISDPKTGKWARKYQKHKENKWFRAAIFHLV